MSSCAETVGVTNATQLDAWSLLDVMVCTEDKNDKWVLDHVDMGEVTTTMEYEEYETTMNIMDAF